MEGQIKVRFLIIKNSEWFNFQILETKDANIKIIIHKEIGMFTSYIENYEVKLIKLFICNIYISLDLKATGSCGER